MKTHEDRDLNGRLSLAKSSGELIGAVYCDALAKGYRCPVILLLDLEDEFGGALARVIMGKADVEQQLAPIVGGRVVGTRATFTMPMEFEKARQLLPGLFPWLRNIFSRPPALGKIAVVVVALGGATSLLADAELEVEVTLSPTTRDRQ